MGQIENYIADLQNVQDLYNLNWVLPYGSAYATANTQFKATLQSQADWDKMKMELFMTAATIGFGAGLGAMFGKAATVGSVAVDQALSAVCNRNMERTFNAMARISASVTFLNMGRTLRSLARRWMVISTRQGSCSSKTTMSSMNTVEISVMP